VTFIKITNNSDTHSRRENYSEELHVKDVKCRLCMREKLITPSVNGLINKGEIMKNGQNMQWENNKANRWQIKKRKSIKETCEMI